MGQSKKILIVCQHYWPESFRINDIASFFVDKNLEVDVLCGIPNYPSGKFFDGYSYFKKRRQVHNKANIRRTFEIPRGNNSNFRIFLNYLSFPLASIFHVPRLLTRKYDKIFIYQLSPVTMSIAGIIVGKLKKTETIMYVLDLWPENLFSVLKVRSRVLRILATKVSHWHYRKVDKLVALSEKMKAHLLEVTTLAPKKILLLPQVCEKIYETDIQDHKLKRKFKNGFNILFTGNISPAQSFETIIAAAKKLKNNNINNINWIIVGDGMSRDWLEDEVNNAGLKDCFYFEGRKPMEDIPRYTPIADVLVGCLVKSEMLEATIPAKVMSYFAAGRPMVLAMDGEVRNLVNNVVKCGYAGPTEDADKLANNITKIYKLTSKERKEMGDRGRKYHFKHFERNMSLENLYNFLMN